jgi:ribosomal protein L28
MDMAGDDPLLLVVLSGVTGQLEDLSDEVLEDSSHVDWCTSSYASGIATLLQVTGDSANRELKTSLGASALTRSRLLSDFTSTTDTITRHNFLPNLILMHFFIPPDARLLRLY